MLGKNLYQIEHKMSFMISITRHEKNNTNKALQNVVYFETLHII